MKKKKKETILKTTLTEFFESAMMQQEPFRSAKQLTHKEYDRLFLLHCALKVAVTVFFLYVCALLLLVGVCVKCAFLQPRICQPHYNRPAVSQSLGIVAWMKIKLYRKHYTHVVLSLIHICIRFSISSFFFCPASQNAL